MCGIAGIAFRDSTRPLPIRHVRRMCDAIAHRGPDDEGVFVEGAVGLGMRRLSIIDLAGGHQPIFNEDRTKVIVFNGEIYNYRELQGTLKAHGHVLRTNSDTETVLHLYEDLGTACVERLRGMFAFAIWDSTNQSLFLARDRFGIKPLYVTAGPWGVAFASELKSILAAGLSNRELDWQALDAYLQLGYIPAPATPFVDVRKLEPGTTLLWRRDGSPLVRRYWDLPTSSAPVPPAVDKAVVDWIDESVAAHLVSDVPVAAFLSGGLDSSAVVASMAVLGERAHAFTARYHGSGSAATDETGLARLVTQKYGARLTVVDVRPDVREIFEPIVRALDEPHADDSMIPSWVLSQAVAAEYKVALTGIGGDELFAGYRRHLGLLLGQYYGRVPRPLQRLASALANRLPEPEEGSLGVDRLKRFLRPDRDETGIAERFFAFVCRSEDEQRAALYDPELALMVGAHENSARARFNSLYREGGSPRGLRAGLYLDYKTFLPDDVLALSDRVSMAHSLEVRVPFVDHVLVERAFGLPDLTKIGWYRNKDLLKRALRQRLPREHARAPKRGFVGPTGSWLRNELRQVVLDELSPERVKRLGYFNPATISRLADDHFARRHNREGILWALLCFSTWHRLYQENAPTPLLEMAS